MNKLNEKYYTNQDVVFLAKDILGKVLHSNIDNKYTSGIITETEAYEGITDKASHAYNGKRTKRTETMYKKGGVAYVYLCYGMHPLFNIITNKVDIPHAILIRAIKPLEGIDIMLQRTNKINIPKDFSNGPGKVSKALGIKTEHSGISLLDNLIWISDENIIFNKKNIIQTTRIGVGYAQEDALLQYRFILEF